LKLHSRDCHQCFGLIKTALTPQWSRSSDAFRVEESKSSNESQVQNERKKWAKMCFYQQFLLWRKNISLPSIEFSLRTSLSGDCLETSLDRLYAASVII